MLSFIQLFQNFLQKNITVTIVIIAVVIVRTLLRKFPKKYSYVLWSFVGIRMIFDISVSSGISLFTLLQMVGAKLNLLLAGQRTNDITQELQKPLGEMPGAVTNVGGEGIANGNAAIGSQSAFLLTEELSTRLVSENIAFILLTIMAFIWIVGMIAIMCYGILSYVKCKQMVRQAVRFRENIWECDRISSPFVLGMLSPQIYIPFQVEEREREYILLHEQCHIRKRDYLIKLLAFCLLAVYWINPFTWVAFHLMSRDMEMRCDEAVLEKLGTEIKKTYSTSLLNYAKERTLYSFAPIAFGEADAGARIRNVLGFKKMQVWLTVPLFLVIAIVGMVCLTNADKQEKHETISTEADVSHVIGETDNMGTISTPKEESQYVLSYGTVGELGLGHLVYTVSNHENVDYKLYFFKNDNADEIPLDTVQYDLGDADFVFPDVRENNAPVGKFQEMYLCETVVLNYKICLLSVAGYEKDGEVYYDGRIYDMSENGIALNTAYTQMLNQRYYEARLEMTTDKAIEKAVAVFYTPPMENAVSPEAQSIRDAAEALFEAYLNKDVAQLQSYMVTSYEGALEVYEAEGSMVSRVLVKGLPFARQEVAVGDKYNVQIEFFNETENDTFQYLDIVLYKEAENSWKVLSYGRDA